MSTIAFLGFPAFSAVVASTGVIYKPGPWYRRLEKPRWTPPNLAFPIVWAVLYVLIAVSGWLVWREVGLALPFAVFGAQMVANALWSWFFFGLRRPDLAMADVSVMWVLVALNIAVFAPVSTLAAWLLVPYLAWITIAWALNLSVWRRNRGRGVFA